LLDVSLDYLLDEDEKLSFNETKEAVDLDSFEVTGKCRDKKMQHVIPDTVGQMRYIRSFGEKS
jgi:hypothetical protein